MPGTRDSRQVQWLRVAGDSVALKEKKELAISGKKMDSVREETNAVSGTYGHERAKSTPKTAPSSEPPTPRGWSASRKKKPQMQKPVWEDQSTAVQKTSWKVLALNYLVTIGILPNGSLKSQNRAVNSAQSAHFRTGRLRNNQTKGRKKGGDKSAVALVKMYNSLGCVFQDTEPPESSSILRKGPKVLGPIRWVRPTKATQRHADIRENKGPSLNKIQVKLLHQRSPHAVQFEDRSQEDTEKTRAMRPRRRVETCQENS